MATTDSHKNFAFVRQPIFDRKKNVVAYHVELRHFGSNQMSSTAAPPDSRTLDHLITEGLAKISNGKKIFMHFDSDSIKKETPLAFSNDEIGINIADLTQMDREYCEKIEKMKSKGFQFIVDGYDMGDNRHSVIEYADIYTVDFRLAQFMNRDSILKGSAQQQIKLLAREVETDTDFSIALGKEFDYFQGNFFTRPDIIPTQNIPSFKMNLIKILEELNKEKLDFNEIEHILKRDVALTYKLLKFMNSASIGIKTTITSIHHALNLLGEKEVKKWLSIMVISSIGSDKPIELLRISLIRAKFCEYIASELGAEKQKNDFFITGMFSLIDAFVGRPIYELINDLPLKSEIKMALLGEENRLLSVLDLVQDYEQGRWNEVVETLEQSNISKGKIVDYYNSAIEWSNFL